MLFGAATLRILRGRMFGVDPMNLVPQQWICRTLGLNGGLCPGKRLALLSLELPLLVEDVKHHVIAHGPDLLFYLLGSLLIHYLFSLALILIYNVYNFCWHFQVLKFVQIHFQEF